MQVVRAYQEATVPAPGEELEFRADDSLQPVHYLREAAPPQYVHRGRAAAAEAEAAAGLRGWAIVVLCRSLSLDNILLLLTGALLSPKLDTIACKQLGMSGERLCMSRADVTTDVPCSCPSRAADGTVLPKHWAFKHICAGAGASHSPLCLAKPAAADSARAGQHAGLVGGTRALHCRRPGEIPVATPWLLATICPCLALHFRHSQACHSAHDGWKPYIYATLLHEFVPSIKTSNKQASTAHVQLKKVCNANMCYDQQSELHVLTSNAALSSQILKCGAVQDVGGGLPLRRSDPRQRVQGLHKKRREAARAAGPQCTASNARAGVRVAARSGGCFSAQQAGI